MEINKGIEAFDEATDFTRGNKDRKPFGKHDGAATMDLGPEYDTTVPTLETPAPAPPAPVVAPVEQFPFKHKMANGTELKAKTVEDLAAQIERAISAPPHVVPAEFDDKPLYEPIEFKRKELSLQEQANILNVWKENPQKALRMLEEAEYGTTMEALLQNLSRAEVRELNRRQEEAGAEFVMETETYNPTPANGKKLTAYLREKGKPITKQNLVLSFQQLVAAGDKTLLRKVDEQVQPAAAAVDDPSLTDTPPPPVVVPSNQGRPEVTAPGQVDVAKFATLPLDQQKKFFADLRRRQ